jgi:hypothetical protein
VVGRHADFQLAADFLDACSAGQLLAGGPQFLDDRFGCVSVRFHDESRTRLAPGTLLADGAISGEHATPGPRRFAEPVSARRL